MFRVPSAESSGLAYPWDSPWRDRQDVDQNHDMLRTYSGSSLVIMLNLPENESMPAHLVVFEGSGIKNSIDLVASLQECVSAQPSRRALAELLTERGTF